MSGHRPWDAILGRVTPPSLELYDQARLAALWVETASGDRLGVASDKSGECQREDCLRPLIAFATASAKGTRTAALLPLLELVAQRRIGDDAVHQPSQAIQHQVTKSGRQVAVDYTASQAGRQRPCSRFGGAAILAGEPHYITNKQGADQVFQDVEPGEIVQGERFGHPPTLSQNRLAHQTALRP